jgi:hypothetical protein
VDAQGEYNVYQIDTFFTNAPTKNHILVGTMKLPGTGNQISGYEYGIWFSGVTSSSCHIDNHEDLFKPNQILHIDINDSSLNVETKIIANCCHDFLCDIKVDSNGILNLMYQGYGEYCACNCCFGLTYHFDIQDYEDYNSIQGIMINGDDRTLKMVAGE